MTSCLKQFCTELFDYNIWIPADAYRSITPTPSISSASSEKDVSEVGEPIDPSQAYADMVDPNAAQSKFKEYSGGGQKMPTTKAGAFARSLGLAPSKADEERLIAEIGKDATFPQIEQWLISCTHPEDNFEWLIQFFQQYDKMNAGTLSRVQVLNILTNLGDTLTSEEANKVLADAGVGDPVDYRTLVAKLIGTQ